TDGSLSSCPPAEAVTWGKVDKETYEEMTESLQTDFSIVMPFLIKALLENRARHNRLAEKIGEKEFGRIHPEAVGYLRTESGFRLYEKRRELCDQLLAEVGNNKE